MVKVVKYFLRAGKNRFTDRFFLEKLAGELPCQPDAESIVRPDAFNLLKLLDGSFQHSFQ